MTFTYCAWCTVLEGMNIQFKMSVLCCLNLNFYLRISHSFALLPFVLYFVESQCMEICNLMFPLSIDDSSGLW